MLGLGVNINKQVGARYSGPLDELGNVDNCVLGVAPYKRLTYLYDDYLVLVVRVDDLEERYFYADYNGNIVESEVLTWLGSSEGVVKKVANQVESSNEAYQNTLSDMPAITVSNVFQSTGIYYDGINDWSIIDDYSELQITSQPLSIYANVSNVDDTGYIFSRNDSSVANMQYGYFYNSVNIHSVIEGSIRADIARTVDLKLITTYASNQVKIKDGINEDINAFSSALTNRSNTQIACRIEGVNPFFFADMNLKTLLLFNADEYSKYDDFVTRGL